MPMVIRDFLPDRFDRTKLPRFAQLWMAPEEFAVLDQDLSEHLVTPGRTGLGLYGQPRPGRISQEVHGS